jgi:Peptidase family S51
VAAVTVLGPQRRPTLDRVLASLDLVGAPIATVTAGWLEREPDDAELMSYLGGHGVNLSLHARWMDVLERDQEYATAELEHRAVLSELQQLYLLQLDHALQATFAVARRTGGHPRVQDMAMADALAMVRLIDSTHLARVRELHAAFYGAWRLEERPVVAQHREEVRDILAAAACLIVTGGHVGELLQVMHLFHVAPNLPPRVVAWSAGAMALTSRVVLFHDAAAQGPAATEVYDEGLGVVPSSVLLPHARRRLRTDDLVRMAVLAKRFQPASCVVLDDGARLDLGPGGELPPGARVVADDGRIVERAAA